MAACWVADILRKTAKIKLIKKAIACFMIAGFKTRGEASACFSKLSVYWNNS